MKKSIIIFSTLILAIFIQSCGKENIKPSSEIVTKQYDYSDFTGLDISDDFQVYVTFSETEESVSIEVNENLQDKLKVEMNNGTLKIGIKNNVNIRGNETLKAYVTTSMINDFEASGDSEIYIQDELTTENVSIKLSGDSKLDGLVAATNVSTDLSGDSEVNLVGSTDILDSELTGDSQIEGYDFVVKNLKIDLKGGSEGYLTVTETLDVKASGDSELHYKGDATIVREVLTGDSKLIKED